MTERKVNKPIVSVVIPAYNHDRFIEECLDSVLSQSFQDFEIIVTDDGSTDKTLERIAKYTDRRIHVYKNGQNRGGSYTANRCIVNSSGKYIAMLSSDDVWLPNKLEKQVYYFESHPDVYAVFSKVNWIDQESNLITNPNFYYHNVFEVENRSRFDWLHHFFFVGNCICHPSGLIRRAVYTEFGGYNPCFANLPDLDLWVRLCMKHEIYIMNEKLINFRHFTDGTNASGQTLPNLFRIIFEDQQIMRHYEKINDVSTFLKVFPTAKVFPELEPQDLPFILGKVAIETGVNYKVHWGQKLLLDFLSDPQSAERIRQKFNFDFPDFFKITGGFDTFRSEGRYIVGEAATDAKDAGDFEINPSFNTFFPRNRNLLTTISRRLHIKKDKWIISQSGLFDEDYYYAQYPDVAQTRMDPIKHYLLFGSDEGRNPSRLFDTKKYVSLYTDVLNSRLNPLIHYIQYGRSEGREPM